MGQRDFDLSALSTLDDRAYDALAPIQWPVTREYPTGTPRMFEQPKFFTPDRKARFIPVTPRPAVNATSRDYPLVLNTGRVRDQWHTMTRTGKSPRLMAHTFEPCVEFHPDDARQAGVDNGALARLTSPWGEMVVRVAVTAEQRRGCVFVPMHWNGEFAGEGRVNALVNPATDPISGQPESKHTPVKAAAYLPKWHAFILSRREIDRPAAGYWVSGSSAEPAGGWSSRATNGRRAGATGRGRSFVSDPTSNGSPIAIPTPDAIATQRFATAGSKAACSSHPTTSWSRGRGCQDCLRNRCCRRMRGHRC